MNLNVDYKDSNGQISKRMYSMKKIAFLKHFAMAGQSYSPNIRKLFRVIGLFLHYNYFLQSDSYYSNRFSDLPSQLSDPTEKSHFSNLAGKAIADFLSKKIDNSLFTVNYEAAMKLYKIPVKGSRPDLIAYNRNSSFAIEAKGYSGGAGDMQKHKAQSRTGGIPVNFTIACVSYNMYKKIKCKYYDPKNFEEKLNPDLYKRLSKQYYQGLISYLDNAYFKVETIEIQNEQFYKIDLIYPTIEYHYFSYPIKRFHLEELFHYLRPQLLLPQKIYTFAKEGLPTDIFPFNFEENMTDIYIDNDRVGLMFNKNYL